MNSSSLPNSLRKAEKKLREIGLLKSKSVRTLEEEEKIKKEAYYRRILDPSYKTDEEKLKEARMFERKQKEIEEMKQRQYARHLKKEKPKKERLEKDPCFQEWEKQRQQHDEYEHNQRQRQQRKQRGEDELRRKEAELFELQTEYIALLKKHSLNNSKTFRLMSLKYHPDKNLGNREWAENQQKKFSDISDSVDSDFTSLNLKN
jgi:hypothetical protein